MAKINAKVAEVIRMNGYEVEETILESGSNNNGVVSILMIENVSYPIDKVVVANRMSMDRTDACILSDGDAVHIFIRAGDSIVESDRLPSKERVIESVQEDLVRASQFKTILTNMGRYGRVEDCLKDMVVFAAMSIVADEGKMWKELESESKKAWNACVDGAGSIISPYDFPLEEYRKGHVHETFLTPFMRFREVSPSIPSVQMAESLIKACGISNRIDYNMAWSTAIPQELARSLLSLASGRTEYNGVGTSVMSVEATRCGMELNLFGTYDPMIGIINRLSGSTCPFMGMMEYSNDSCDTILTFPPVGVRYETNLDNNRLSRCSEAMAIENAVQRINRGGRVCAIVPIGFLFSMRDRRTRDFLVERYSVSAIIEIERPLEITGITFCLLVLESGVHNGCIVGRRPFNVKDMPNMVNSLKKAFDGDIDDNLFFGMNQMRFYDNWSPRYLIAENDPDFVNPSAIPITDVVEVIRGCTIPSSKYYPEGSPLGIPYLRISNIRNDRIDFTDARMVSSDDGKVFSRKGDIVLSIQGVIGKIAVAGDRVFIPSSQIAMMRPKEGVDSEFVATAMRSKYFRDQLEANATGSAIKTISIRTISTLKIDPEDAMRDESDSNDEDVGGDGDA